MRPSQLARTGKKEGTALLLISSAKTWDFSEKSLMGKAVSAYRSPLFQLEAERLLSFVLEREDSEFTFEKLLLLPKTQKQAQSSPYREQLQEGFWQARGENAKVFWDLFRQQLYPALWAMDGLVAKQLAKNEYGEAEWQEAKDKLRIASALYGLLRGDDLVCPHRLDFLMLGKSAVNYWQEILAPSVPALFPEGSWLVNLASKEYSELILPLLPPEYPVLSLRFEERVGDKFVSKSTLAKMARGKMLDFCLRHPPKSPEDLLHFSPQFEWEEERSSEAEWIFVKK